MTVPMTRRAAVLALAAMAPWPIRARDSEAARAATEEPAVLDRPTRFDVSTVTGSLKETVKSGQALLWRAKNNPSQHCFQITDISIGFLRSETGGDVKLTFSGNVSSVGYLALEDVKLNVVVRSKGGASLHSWSIAVPVKCGDKNRPLTPVTGDVPRNIAATVFNSVNAVEVLEQGEPTAPGLKVRRCDS